jgi:UPF0271 protein
MRDYSLDRLCRDLKYIPVLDTAAFLAGIQLNISMPIYITTPSVLDEIRDPESRARLELALSTGKVVISDPGKRYLDRVTHIIEEEINHNLVKNLSTTDLSILALGIKLLDNGCIPIIFTDDFLIHKIAGRLGIETVGVKRSKPAKLSRIKGKIYICIVCGFKTGKPPKDGKCPRCSSKLTVKDLGI